MNKREWLIRRRENLYDDLSGLVGELEDIELETAHMIFFEKTVFTDEACDEVNNLDSAKRLIEEAMTYLEG